jgi:hypothetical protein
MVCLFFVSAFMALPESVKKALLDDPARTHVGLSHEKLSSISSDQALHIFYGSITQREVSDFTADTGSSTAVVSVNEVKKLHFEMLSTLQSAGISHGSTLM